MSFKLVIVFVMVALTSARTAMHNNMLMNQQIQMQNDQVQQQQLDQMQQQQNQIQQQQMNENQQRFQQRQELEDQRQMQEQLILDQQQDRLDNIRSAHSSFMNTQKPANYNYGYSISDYNTDDIKSQQGIRRGDNVQRQYTFVDTDGYQRAVDYTVDEINGFSAGVRREEIRPQYIYIEYPIQASQYLRHRSVSLIPASYSTAHVSKNENGVHNEYTTSTSSNY